MSMFERIRALFGSDRPGRTAAWAGGMETCADAAETSMISCEDALRLVNEYLDGELQEASTEDVRRHFDVCGRCYPHLQLETAFRDAVRRAASGDAAPPELKGRVERLLAEAQRDD